MTKSNLTLGVKKQRTMLNATLKPIKDAKKWRKQLIKAIEDTQVVAQLKRLNTFKDSFSDVVNIFNDNYNKEENKELVTLYKGILEQAFKIYNGHLRTYLKDRPALIKKLTEVDTSHLPESLRNLYADLVQATATRFTQDLEQYEYLFKATGQIEEQKPKAKAKATKPKAKAKAKAPKLAIDPKTGRKVAEIEVLG